MIAWLRSLFFNIFFFAWLLVLLLFAWIFLPFPRKVMQRMLRVWSWITLWGIRVFGGIHYRFEGLENIPEGPVMIASKHQSIWDTFVMYVLLDDPQYVLKQELMKIPLWGRYAAKSEHIAIDRDAGAKALRDMVEQCTDRLNKGRQIIIFPEGTRTAPGVTLRYHPGVAAIYQKMPENSCVVPAALNSGSFWGRRKYYIRPGTITLKFLEPIPTGLPRKEFMNILEERIEGASTVLYDAAAAPAGKNPPTTP
ncbi:lysophospholipid acyltransferase family protein [Thalassospiraceae bacterium LMO-JJ14]|nr:lysophospholipid acyltransferase family protein [Thalassospiraceae bacterium LMO-JJ14]